MGLILVFVKNPFGFFMFAISPEPNCELHSGQHKVSLADPVIELVTQTRQQFELHPARLRFGTPSHGGLVSEDFPGFNWVMFR